MPRCRHAKPGRVRSSSVETPRAAVRIVVVTPQQRRNRPRRDDEPRLDAKALALLLAAV